MTESSIVRSTTITALSTLASRIMGFARDMIVAAAFGASGALDGFYVAFRIPNLFRRLVAEGSLTISFIPVYTDYLVNRGEREALELAQKTLSILVLVLVAITGVGIAFSPQIVSLFARGFADARIIALTVDLNRIMFPYLFLVGLVAFSMGVLNSHGRFFAAAFSPVLLNVGFIIGATLLSLLFVEPLYGLALGVLIGGVLQVLLQVPDLVRSGFRLRFSIDLNHPGIRRIFRMIVPALFGIAVYQLNILMSTMLASMLAEGSISYIYYSDRLNEMVLGVFVMSIGNVVLPAMSRHTAREDFGRLRALYADSVSASLFVGIPACVALIAASFPIVSVLFARGAFTMYHAEMTARALFFASMGIPALSVLRITTPAFYSLKDTRTPVIASTVSFVVNIAAGYALMHTPLAHAGLTLGNAIASTLQTAILLAVLNRRIGGIAWGALAASVLKYAVASAVMCGVIVAIAQMADWRQASFVHRAGTLAALVAAGGAAYFSVCYLLRVKELHFLVSKIRSRLGR
ncbi:MAG TPA: murein biosynthesis integral membrane protein MurJ [Spirochaetota bacterium]|nr:murein biosynthesis integral membrane protein MurJ [Spirochaetota bacterium]HPU89351.1 murein biosynthesis integral membrane protein MurJ [Spirochaetota bacterium]